MPSEYETNLHQNSREKHKSNKGMLQVIGRRRRRESRNPKCSLLLYMAK